MNEQLSKEIDEAYAKSRLKKDVMEDKDAKLIAELQKKDLEKSGKRRLEVEAMDEKLKESFRNCIQKKS